MRIIKKPEERKNEILDAAQTLFITKGYVQTTIIDILNVLGIAKGTFYYYFKSKEEVLDAIIARIISADVARISEIVLKPGLSAPEKLFLALDAQKPQTISEKQPFIAQIQMPDNAQMRQKSLVQTVLQFSPLFAEIIRQGIEEGVFAVEKPQETMEFLLTCAQVNLDPSLFSWDGDALHARFAAFITLAERALGATPGVLTGLSDLLVQENL